MSKDINSLVYLYENNVVGTGNAIGNSTTVHSPVPATSSLPSPSSNEQSVSTPEDKGEWLKLPYKQPVSSASQATRIAYVIGKKIVQICRDNPELINAVLNSIRTYAKGSSEEEEYTDYAGWLELPYKGTIKTQEQARHLGMEIGLKVLMSICRDNPDLIKSVIGNIRSYARRFKTK